MGTVAEGAGGAAGVSTRRRVRDRAGAGPCPSGGDDPRTHMLAMSRSTRSSTARNGSLQSTVRWA